MRYRNPFTANPNADQSIYLREDVLRRLDSSLLEAQRPAHVSIQAERYMGGEAIIRNFLSSRKEAFHFRVVECSADDLGTGASAADFYRQLIRHIHERVDNLPAEAQRAARRLHAGTSVFLDDQTEDFEMFFDQIRTSGPPLLLVFYAFDQLPQCFPFGGRDWGPLRKLVDLMDVYLLIGTRRPLRRIEQRYGLKDSEFVARINNNILIGLLSEAEARARIVDRAQAALGKPAWEQWLIDAILQWSGRHPYCIEQICFELFEWIWNEQQQFSPKDADALAERLSDILYEMFNRLYQNLVKDGLHTPLIRAIESGGKEPRVTDVQDLLHLGYFVPELAKNSNSKERRYNPFSTLFRGFLLDCGALNADPAKIDEPLTQREQETLRLLCQGLGRKQIAHALRVSENTVKVFIRNIYQKLGVSTQAEAAARAVEHHLI
jgi:DNA-binding CsgD family transcriptional regulator